MRRTIVLFFLICSALALPSGLRAEDADESLAAAVATLRHNSPMDFADEEAARVKGEAIVAAWQHLLAAPVESAALLRAEAERVMGGDEEDYAFLLGAAALLFEMEGLDSVPDIARYWAACRGHLALNSYYTFVIGVRMGMLRDVRAVPALRELLADRDITHFVPQHSLMIQYPLTLWFTWGILGARGEEGLLAVVDDPEADPRAVVAAMNLLSMLQSMAVLDRSRDLLEHEDEDIRRSAIWCIGRFGHPDDYATVERGVADRDGRDFAAWQRAADDYMDLRLVERYLEGIDGATAEQTAVIVAGLFGLPCTEGMKAVQALLDDADSPLHEDAETAERVRGMFSRFTGLMARIAGVEHWDAFLALPPEEQDAAWNTLWASRDEERFTLREGDRRLTREEFDKAIREWTEERRITDGEFAWVKERQVMDIARETDLPALIELRANMYSRVSDECLYEAAILNDIIYRLGRLRYRSEFGITRAVVAPRP